MSAAAIVAITAGVGFAAGFFLASLLAMEDAMHADYPVRHPPAAAAISRLNQRVARYKAALTVLALLLLGLVIKLGVAAWA